MKIIVAFLMTASLVACGGKSKKQTTPNNTNTDNQMKTDGTGGTTYGGAKPPTPAPTNGADPCAGQ